MHPPLLARAKKQVLFGLLIIYRSTTPGVGPSSGNKDTGLFTFQVAGWSMFIISVGGQILGQWFPLGNAVFVNNVIGFSLFPMYLDGASCLMFFLSCCCCC